MVNCQRFRNVGRRAQLAGRGHCGERFCDEARDVAEADSLIEERRNGDFIRRVKGRGRASAGTQRLDRKTKRWKTHKIGALESQSAERGKVRRSHPRGDPIRIGQTVRNRSAHVRRRHAGDQGSVGEGDEPVHDRLRVHDDIEPVGWQAEEMMGFDQLETLIHQTSRIDRHLRPHHPVGVGKRLLTRGGGNALSAPFAERAAGSRDGHHLNDAGIASANRLEQGVVLGIHRQHHGAFAPRPLHHHLAGAYQRLLVGESDRASGCDRGEGRAQPCRRRRSPKPPDPPRAERLPRPLPDQRRFRPRGRPGPPSSPDSQPDRQARQIRRRVRSRVSPAPRHRAPPPTKQRRTGPARPRSPARMSGRSSPWRPESTGVWVQDRSPGNAMTKGEPRS